MRPDDPAVRQSVKLPSVVLTCPALCHHFQVVPCQSPFDELSRGAAVGEKIDGSASSEVDYRTFVRNVRASTRKRFAERVSDLMIGRRRQASALTNVHRATTPACLVPGAHPIAQVTPVPLMRSSHSDYVPDTAGANTSTQNLTRDFRGKPPAPPFEPMFGGCTSRCR
jgi:hypothetical protein